MSNYFLTKRSKYIYFGSSTVTIIMVVSLFIFISHSLPYLWIYFTGLGLFGFYVLIRNIQEEHIVVSENRIEYYAPGIVFETDWKNIEKISKQWQMGFWQECLLIDNSNVRMIKWSFFLGRNYHKPFEFVPRKTLIPLSCFSENWRNSELGQQIKQFAPQLFEQEIKKSA